MLNIDRIKSEIADLACGHPADLLELWSELFPAVRDPQDDDWRDEFPAYFTLEDSSGYEHRVMDPGPGFSFDSYEEYESWQDSRDY